MCTQLMILLVFAAMTAQKMPTTISLEGDVVARSTGAPIAGVRLQLQGMQRPLTTTDPAGHFTFPSVSAVNSVLSASAPALMPRSQSVSIRPTDSSIYVKLEMIEPAVITGKVLDQDGWPAAGAYVSAAYYSDVNGQRQLHSDSTVHTNDLGEYRLRLRPGKYYVKADPGTLTKSWDERYTGVWYPDTPNSASARVIELVAGQNIAGIDVKLPIEPGAQMRGNVIWPTTYHRGNQEHVWLVQQLLNGSSRKSYLLRSDDTFTIRHLPPGKYMLLAEVGEDINDVRPPTYWASQTLHVSGENIEGVSLTPVETPVRDLQGVVVTEEGSVRPPQCRIALQRVNANWRVDASTRSDGTFVLHGVWPGKFRFSISCSGSAALDAHFGKMDLLNDQFEFDGSVIGPIQITVGNVERIVGTLTDEDNRPIIGATVYFLPVDLGVRWSAHTDQNGAIASAARPGRYRAFVLEESFGVEDIDDPVFQKIHQNDFPVVTIRKGPNDPLKLALKRR
jgi:hypothetical protein